MWPVLIRRGIGGIWMKTRTRRRSPAQQITLRFSNSDADLNFGTPTLTSTPLGQMIDEAQQITLKDLKYSYDPKGHDAGMEFGPYNFSIEQVSLSKARTDSPLPLSISQSSSSDSSFMFLCSRDPHLTCAGPNDLLHGTGTPASPFKRSADPAEAHWSHSIPDRGNISLVGLRTLSS